MRRGVRLSEMRACLLVLPLDLAPSLSLPLPLLAMSRRPKTPSSPIFPHFIYDAGLHGSTPSPSFASSAKQGSSTSLSPIPARFMHQLPPPLELRLDMNYSGFRGPSLLGGEPVSFRLWMVRQGQQTHPQILCDRRGWSPPPRSCSIFTPPPPPRSTLHPPFAPGVHQRPSSGESAMNSLGRESTSLMGEGATTVSGAVSTGGGLGSATSGTGTPATATATASAGASRTASPT